MALFGALIAGLIALAIAPGYLLSFDVTPKACILLAGTAGMLILAVRRKDLAGAPPLFAGFLALNGVSLAISTAFSANPSLSFFGSTWRLFGAGIQIAAMLFAWLLARDAAGRPERARIVLRGVAITALAVAGYGIAQYLGHDPLLPPAGYRMGGVVQPPATLGSAASFATWLLMAMFLCLVLARLEKNRVWQALALMAAGVSLAALALSGSRAAAAGLCGGAVVWLGWRGFRAPRRGAAAAGALALCAAALAFSPPGENMRSDPKWSVDGLWGGARPLVWRGSLWMSARRPMFGYGPEMFLAEFPQFESKKLARSYPDSTHESPSNIFLDALAAQGAIGLLALGGLCTAGFAALWKLKRQQPAVAAWMAAALAAGIVSLQFTAFTIPTAVLWLTTIALAAALAEQAGGPRPSPVLSGLAPLLVVGMLYLGMRLASADHVLETIRRLTEVHDVRAVPGKYREYWAWRLPGANASLWYSRAWLEIATSSSDLDLMEQSLAISERAALRSVDYAEDPSDAWYNLAEILAAHDDYFATDTALRRAIDARPNWYKPHWMLARELRMAANFEEAEREASLAVELDGGHHAEVKRTLDEIRERLRGQ